MVTSTNWFAAPVNQVTSELSRLNGGSPPRSFQECCDVASALNWRVMIMPVPECPPCSDPKKHLIYVPQGDDRHLFQYTLHELSEVITGKEGGEPEFQADTESRHHDVACLIFGHLEPWFEKQRRKLERERSIEVHHVQQFTADMRALSEDLKAFALAAVEGEDLSRRVLPDARMLVCLQKSLRVHVERISMIDARLRCL